MCRRPRPRRRVWLLAAEYERAGDDIRPDTGTLLRWPRPRDTYGQASVWGQPAPPQAVLGDSSVSPALARRRRRRPRSSGSTVQFAGIVRDCHLLGRPGRAAFISLWPRSFPAVPDWGGLTGRARAGGLDVWPRRWRVLSAVRASCPICRGRSAGTRVWCWYLGTLRRGSNALAAGDRTMRNTGWRHTSSRARPARTVCAGHRCA